MGTRELLSATVAVVLLAGCTTTSAGTTHPAATPTRDATAVRSPDTSTEDVPPPMVERGPELAPEEVRPRTAGIAWQLDDAVLLTTTTGTSMGHLPGWRIDRGASDRLATAVLVGPDASLAVTTDGLVPLDRALPLAEGHTLVLADGQAEVHGRDGAVVTTLDLPDPDELWVSATGSVVGVVDGDHWDVEAGAPLEVPAGCRVADRHTADDPLLVCDAGHRLVGGGTEMMLPNDTPAGWVTVGTTGDEVLATVTVDDHPALWAGSLSQGTIEPRYDPGVGLFFRASGPAWVAHLGGETALDLFVVPESNERVAELPPATDAAMWTR